MQNNSSSNLPGPRPSPQEMEAAAAAAAFAARNQNVVAQGPLQPYPPMAHMPPMAAMPQPYVPPWMLQHGAANTATSSGQLPWAVQPGDKKEEVPIRKYKTVTDACGLCDEKCEELFIFDCSHFPFCKACMKSWSITTNGTVVCPIDRKVVKELYRCFKVKKDD